MSNAETVHDNAVVDAAKHHTDLNVFAVIEAILESGALYTASGQRAASQIGATCRAEQQKQLRLYDQALRKAGLK